MLFANAAIFVSGGKELSTKNGTYYLEILTHKAPTTTAADDSLEYVFEIFHPKQRIHAKHQVISSSIESIFKIKLSSTAILLGSLKVNSRPLAKCQKSFFHRFQCILQVNGEFCCSCLSYDFRNICYTFHFRRHQHFLAVLDDVIIDANKISAFVKILLKVSLL